MEGRTCEISAAGEKKKSGKGAREGTRGWEVKENIFSLSMRDL